MKTLICCDYSDASKFVLAEAEKFLKAFSKVEIEILTVEDITVISTAGLYNNTEMMVDLDKEADVVKTWAEEIFNTSSISFSKEVGNPTDSILKKIIAIKPDLVIMGTHGRSGFSRLFTGSIAEHVLRHANCKVLVIPVKQVNAD